MGRCFHEPGHFPGNTHRTRNIMCNQFEMKKDGLFCFQLSTAKLNPMIHRVKFCPRVKGAKGCTPWVVQESNTANFH